MVSEDVSIRVVRLRCFVTLCKTVPYRNSLTYLLTYLGAKIDGKSVTLLQCGQFDPKFQVKGSPPKHFCTDS